MTYGFNVLIKMERSQKFVNYPMELASPTPNNKKWPINDRQCKQRIENANNLGRYFRKMN
jgi:hypothetical protein